jgi:hypothetical protein
MILKGSQRAGASALAAHLLNDRDNDHITVHQLRGFVADDLHGALHEAHAISKGTQCKQFMFSVSLNPPKDSVLSDEAFERAANACEERLGLTGQPRAIIIHEKEGRRHAHVVWSRIDANQMRAINMAHFKTKLTALSKELYLEHGWELPDGLKHMGGKSPLNFDLAEWQQAKRIGIDPREIKQTFQECYARSDGLKAFGAALEERGYHIAQGDRRGIVALDLDGNVYSVARYAGVKTSELRARLGDGDGLKSVAMVSAEIDEKVTAKLRRFIAAEKDRQRSELKPLKVRAAEVTEQHRTQRTRLAAAQDERERHESAIRAKRLRTGIAGLWDRFSGRAAAIHKDNQLDAWEASKRDARQRDALIREQMDERRKVQTRIEKMRAKHIDERRDLHREVMRRSRLPDDDHTTTPRPRGPSLHL